jgi:hypothetical protein
MFDIESLDIYQLEQLRDACNRRLLEMRRTQGLSLNELLRLLDDVKVTLRDQGKEWHSLERWQWMDGEIRFWLNPHEQDIYRTGWFSIDDLIAWSQERGPIVVEELEEGEGPWEQADGVAITWLPSGRPSSSAGGHGEARIKLV